MREVTPHNQLIQILLEHKVQNGTIVMGAAAAVAPTQQMVQSAGEPINYIATHGIGVLTYIEMIQILGAIGVLLASLNIVVNWVKSYRKSQAKKHL